ncbi:hypothetical protein [Lactococcus lactis]|uniref:Uncharacterized protein n=1 Tax=Lactococcus lactis TaxID=1358 RepID=A0AAP4DU67_9LACT|nr:hypothetical protein [Lactococcus lactis]MDG4968259.1 hypothetical protein [Lactococcus lactis]MDG4976381.1 hypothetical protein [Lactococcus lactis]MDG5102185.1 hypothetical protein [Lactococcus lactis]
MIRLKTPQGWSIPIKEYDKLQKKNLKEIKYHNRQIKDFDKLTAYYPEVLFKNVTRNNSDGTLDIIVDSGVATEFHTGFLPKRFYKALRMKKDKGLLSSKWNYLDIIQVSESEIIKSFDSSVSIDEAEKIVEASIKKGVKYFD